MATNFFSQFPSLAYDIDGEGSYVKLTDISRTADITTFNEDKVSYYTYYEVNDGDRPDTVSQLLYGTPEYYWSLFVLNDSLKAGLNNAWPLSNLDFEAMIANEYDKYSALTISPVLQSANDIQQQHSDFSIIPLNETYLPYLRLASPETGLLANIAFYDRRLLQLVIYDVKPSNAGSYPNATSLDLRNAFLSSNEYIIQWINPYNSLTETVLYNACQSLKAQWVDLVALTFETADVSNYSSVANGSLTKEQYVFNKRYMCPSVEYSWPYYRNAAYQYYTTDSEDVINYENAYDVIMAVIGGTQIFSTSISYYEKEQLENDGKRKIKVVRPDKIRDFSRTYFTVLNS